MGSCKLYGPKKSYYNYHKGIYEFIGTKKDCDQRRQRIVIDDQKSIQYGLIANCQIDNSKTGDCILFKMGTVKLISEYQNDYIIKQTIYKPIYDSIGINNMYPDMSKENVFTYSKTNNHVYPLGKIDSIMISQSIIHKKFQDCGIEYLRTIKGFYIDTILIPNEKFKKSKYFMTI
jgi:hypothetical protein